MTLPFDINFPYAGSKDLVWEMAVTAGNATYFADSANATDKLTYGPLATLGAGCATPKGTFALGGPIWSDASDHSVHAQWTFDGAPAFASCALLIGGSDPALSIPGLCGGGKLRSDVLLALGASSDANGHHVAIDVVAPYSAALAGRSLYSQVAAADASQAGLPIAASNGHKQTILAFGANASFGRLYATSSATATTGTIDLGSQLVTRFGY